MTALTNPPQAVPTPIRNFVSVEDRVSILLNRSGSSRFNPIVGSNRSLNPGVPSYSLTEGAAFSLKFAIAEISESVDYAVVQHIDDENLALSSPIDIKSALVADTDSMRYTANLIAGIHLRSSAVSTKNLVTIKTSLNRQIQQVVYAQDAPENIVTLGGKVTTSASPYSLTGSDIIQGLETFQIPMSFFATWNDEIGRQHGSSEVALTGNISKPYGGMETVEIVTTNNYPNQVLLAETEISKVTSFPHLPLSVGSLGIVVRFRSKPASSEMVIALAYLRFLDPCVETPPVDDPPDCEDDTGGVLEPQHEFNMNITDMGTDASGTSNTTVNVVLSGYKGGVRNDTGSAVAYAGVVSGSQTIAQTSTGTKTITMTDSGLLLADIVIAEIQNSGGTLIGNSLVYKRSYTAASMPSAPTVTAATYNFATNAISVTVSDFGFIDSAATIYARSVGSGVTATSASMSESDTFADFDTGELLTDTLAYSSSTATYSKTLAFASSPKALLIYAKNSYGVSESITLTDDASTAASVRTAPVLGSLSLISTSTTDDGARMSISSLGGQTQGTFILRMTAYPNGIGSTSVTENFASVSASTGTLQLSFSTAAMKNVNGWYTAQLIGYNSTSAAVSISNVTA